MDSSLIKLFSFEYVLMNIVSNRSKIACAGMSMIINRTNVWTVDEKKDYCNIYTLNNESMTAANVSVDLVFRKMPRPGRGK